mgnify:FL=1
MIEKINNDLKIAMKEKDVFKMSVIRMLKSALQLESIAQKHELSDNEVVNILKKQVKLRKDSIEEYKKYNKMETVDSLEKEIAILNVYLPEEMNEDEIKVVIEKIFDDVKPSSIKDMGKVMASLNKELEGKNADIGLASKIVKEKLNSI